MSWIEKLENTPCTITTGDGRQFSPLWREAKRTRAYNYAAYNFSNIKGTLVDRRLAEGNQYDLAIMFTGENHLDTAARFSESADDRRAWTLVHPYWGAVRVQPTSIEEDKSLLNSTLFNIKIWETIPNMYPWPKQLANDKVLASHEAMTELAAKAFASQVEVNAAVRTSLLSTTAIVDNAVSANLSDSSLFAKFKTEVANAKRVINNAIQTPVDVMRSILTLVNYPIQTIQSVEDRLQVLKEVYDKMGDVFLKNPDRDSLSIYESTGTTIIGAMASTIMSPSENDFQTRGEIINAVDLVKSTYADLLENIDTYAADRSDSSGAYTPDDETLRQLSTTTLAAVANAYDYALGAKQERRIYLEEDSNVIVQAHRFYGLDKEDVNLSFFIKTNDLGMDELIGLKKGRKLLYYK